MTGHSQIRTQQRGIPRMVIDLLEQFGARERASNGAEMVFFDKAGRRHLKAYAGPLAALLDEYLDVFAVISGDSKVITVGHRYERISRH